MQPHVFIVGLMDSPIVRNIVDTLREVGISTFHGDMDLTSGEVWTNYIQEEFNRAACAILILESHSKYGRTTDSLYLNQEIGTVLGQLSKNPKLTIIPIIESSLSPQEIPTELQSFQSIYFTQGLTPSDKGLLIDTVFRAWHSIENKILPLEQLTAEATVLNTRLSFIISQSRKLDVVILIIVLVAALLGLLLSIPKVLIAWSLPNYWLFVAPIIAVTGASAAIYLSIRERQERRRILIATLVKNKLEELLKGAESLRERKRMLRQEQQLKLENQK